MQWPAIRVPDQAFNEMIGPMSNATPARAGSTTTGNQGNAHKQGSEAFGAPDERTAGWRRLRSGFMVPDTGSRMFNHMNDLSRHPGETALRLRRSLNAARWHCRRAALLSGRSRSRAAPLRSGHLRPGRGCRQCRPAPGPSHLRSPERWVAVGIETEAPLATSAAHLSGQVAYQSAR